MAEDKVRVSRRKTRVSTPKTPARIIFTALACLTLFFCGVYLGLTSFKGLPGPKSSNDGDGSVVAANQHQEQGNKPAETDVMPDANLGVTAEEPVTPVLKTAVTAPVSLTDLAWPSAGEIQQEPGWYYSSNLEAWRYVSGVVIKGDSGRDVYATLPGLVQKVSDDPVEGKSMEFFHGSGLVTKYSGIRLALYAEGDEIQKGDVIARLQGPDLVFEITRNEEALNPRNYLSQSK